VNRDQAKSSEWGADRKGKGGKGLLTKTVEVQRRAIRDLKKGGMRRRAAKGGLKFGWDWTVGQPGKGGDGPPSQRDPKKPEG